MSQYCVQGYLALICYFCCIFSNLESRLSKRKCC